MSISAATRNPSTSTPSDGSRTITLHDFQPGEEDEGSPAPVGSLRLQGGPRSRQRVAWVEDVIDNEGCGRKSSKICCIYHKPKRFDESSDEENSSDDDSDHEHGEGGPSHSHSHSHKHHPGGGKLGGSHEPERNAYEITPSAKKGKDKACTSKLYSLHHRKAHKSQDNHTLI